MTSPLAVSGTARAVATPGGSAPLLASWSGASCVRPVRKATAAGASEPNGRTSGGPLVGVGGAAATAWPRLAHVEPDEPVLAGHLDRARVGQPALDEAHGAPDHGGGLEARAQQPGHLGEERQALPSRLGVAQGLALVLEDLGPLQGLCGQARPTSRGTADRARSSSGCATKARERTPSGPDAADERLAHDRHRLRELVQDPGTISVCDVRRAPRRRRRCRPGRSGRGRSRRRRAPVERAPWSRERSAGWPLLARQARPRSPAAGHAHHRRLRAQGTPAAGDGRMGHVARRRGGGQRRAELVQMLAALQVDELGQGQPGPLDGLRRGAGDGEEEGPVGLGDLTVVVPVHDDGADRVVGDDQRDDGEGPEPFRLEGRVDVGSLALQVVDRLGEEGDVVAQDRAVGLQRGRARRPTGRRGRTRTGGACAACPARRAGRRSTRRRATRRAGRRRPRRPPGPGRRRSSEHVPWSASAAPSRPRPVGAVRSGSPSGPSTAARCAARAGRRSTSPPRLPPAS